MAHRLDHVLRHAHRRAIDRDDALTRVEHSERRSALDDSSHHDVLDQWFAEGRQGRGDGVGLGRREEDRIALLDLLRGLVIAVEQLSG